MLPTLFISHGSPELATMKHEVSNFLQELANKFEKPKYIIMVSAHWTSDKLEILTNENPSIVYDFYGFPEPLYQIKYQIKNDIKCVNKVFDTINSIGLHVEKNGSRVGYDHGVWVPLSLMYKEADIPVVQLSLPMSLSAKELVEVGEALQPLKDEALIIGSGNMTHNLSDMNRDINAPSKNYAKEFRDWVVNHIENKNEKGLIDELKEAPYYRKNHPTTEHFLPLFIVYGASKGKSGTAINDVYMYSNQSMEMIIFKD